MSDLSIQMAKYVSAYKIELEFSDGKVQIVDFAPFLNSSKHTEIKKYLDLELFQKFSLVNGDLDWNDFDLTFLIWDLYHNKLIKSLNSTDQQAS